MVNEKINSGTTGLCLKLQRTESFPYKMMMNQNCSNEVRARIDDDDDDDDGPTFINGSSNDGCSDIYDVPGVGIHGSTSSNGDGGGGGGVTVVGRTLLQPFNSSFKSPGTTGMAATLKFPFTSAQWQELERQALIYKYMIACVPIPPNLLIPIPRNHTETTTVSHSTLGRFNLRFSNNIDPEPGRCRRTDGKKWRCSRDVAPDQKYCERHMHRGRPRSRKHVEVETEINNKINLSSSSSSVHPPLSLTTNPSTTTKSYNLSSGFSSKPTDFRVPPFENMAVSASPYTRCMELMMKRETVPMAASSDQQWEELMHSKTELRTNNNNSYSSNPIFQQQQQQYQETLNLNSYIDFNGTENSVTHQEQNDQFCLFLNPELTSINENLRSDHLRESPRRFIDAWSTPRDHISKPTEPNIKSSSSFKFSPNLSLSMSGSNSTEEEIDQIEMGIGLKSQTLNWMNPVSWTSSQPGGPLGEVLQSSATTSKSSINGGELNLMTDCWVSSKTNNGENNSPRLTTISSPSGVLQKTLASLSDSSSNSSPNSFKAAAAAAKSENVLQLLNQSKFQSS